MKRLSPSQHTMARCVVCLLAMSNFTAAPSQVDIVAAQSRQQAQKRNGVPSAPPKDSAASTQSDKGAQKKAPPKIYQVSNCRDIDNLITEYTACRLTLRGKFVEYIEADPKIEKFGPYLIYLGCGAKADDCKDEWTLLNPNTGKRQFINSELPAFDGIVSSPTFKWPYVAYLGYTPTRADRGRFECVVYDWKAQQTLRRLTAFVAPLPETDAAGMSPPPAFSRDRKTVTCSCDTCDGKPHVFKMSLTDASSQPNPSKDQKKGR
ncbi:MAG: hypothetical protein ABI977_23355 [Acidobacteriota bacterium]